jgi:hypothetical protein
MGVGFRMTSLRCFPYLSIRRLRLILVGALQQPEPRCLRFRGAGILPSIKWGGHMGGERRYRSGAGRTGRWGRMTGRGRLAVITTAVSVLTSLVLVPGMAGAEDHGPTAAAGEKVGGEVVGSPQMVSLTPDNLGIAMWSVPDGTTLINVSREVNGSKVSNLAFTDGSTSSAMPGLRLPGEVRDATFGPDSTAYLTVAGPDDQTAGWLLRLGRADSSATVLHTWPVDPVERYRAPYSVEYANDRLIVEALSANTIHSCLPQLEAFDLAGASVGTFEATSCGGRWQADDGLVFASDAESYGGLFVDPATGASHRIGFPSPGPIWNIAQGPGGRIAVVTGNGHNRCETGSVSVIDPSGVLLSRPLHEVFGVASDGQCLVRALTLLDNGAAVVGADLPNIGAALFRLAPDGSSKQIWTSATETIRSLHAAAGDAFVMASTSADSCGLPHLEDCGRVQVSAGTDAGVRQLASFGGEYGDSRTAPFELVSIGRNDVIIVSQRNQCLCSDPDTEYALDRVGALGIGRQSWHDPAGGSAPPPTFTYVAMGDSYSSGEGNPPFDAGTDVFRSRKSRDKRLNGCHRSAVAWPRQLGATSDTHLACSGAKIRHLYSAQEGFAPDNLDQISRLRTIELSLAKSGDHVDLVTLTIGGNDIGFDAIIGDCWVRECLAHDDKNLRDIRGLRLPVADALKTIKAQVPFARVVLVGYPRLFPGQASDNTGCRDWLSSREQMRANTLSAEMDVTLHKAADDAEVSYVSVLDALDDHELCTSESWIFEVNPALWATDQRQGHPLYSGQQAIANIVRSNL